MNRRLVVASLLFAAWIGSSIAPPAMAASVFSREGWGWWWDQGDPAARGRGGTSVAVTGHGATGETNPATTALAELSYAYGAWAGDITRAKGDAGSFRQRSDLLPHMGGVIVLPRGVRALALLRMQTDAAYDRTQRFESNASGPFELATKGEGGWNRLEIGVSGPAFERRLLWGVAVSRIMGSAKEELTSTFTDSTSFRIRDAVEARLGGGWMGTAGVVLRPDPRFQLGAAATLGGSSRVTQEVHSIEGGTEDVSTRAHQDLPSQLAVGVQGKLMPRLGVSADVVRTLWGDAAFRRSGGSDTFPFVNTTRWGAGIEYAAAVPENAQAPRLPRWVARAGFAHDESYVQATDGSRINEDAVTLGMSARAGHGRATIDLGLEVGKRGSRADLGVEERFYRLSVGVVFSSVPRQY